MSNMDFTLEENDEVFLPNVMDLNKSFCISDDLDIDLKEVAEPMFEEAQLDFKNLSLDEETMKKKSDVSQGMILPKFGPRSLISEAIDGLFDKNNYKSCKGCGKLKNLLEFRNHEKKCRRKSMIPKRKTDVFKCSHCLKIFSMRSALVLHVKTTKSCGNALDGVKYDQKSCKSCPRSFSGKRLSLHIFQGSCKEQNKVIKNVRC